MAGAKSRFSLSRGAFASAYRTPGLLVCAILLTTCTEPEINPLPVLTAVSPNVLVAGAAGATITVAGSNFVPRSQARLDGAERATHYQDAQTLTVDLLEEDLESPGLRSLSIANRPPGGGISEPLALAIIFPVPVITNVTPSVTAPRSGAGSMTLIVTGTGFSLESGLYFGGFSMLKSTATKTELRAEIQNFWLTIPGRRAVLVTNPGPGGGVSNSFPFDVEYPVPTLTVVAPDSALVGTPFTLTVNGVGFGFGSLVRWNGQDRPSTYVSPTRLVAAIPANDLTDVGEPTISVFNPAPGGGASNATSYRVVEPAPLITAVSPAVIAAGTGPATVTITGTNFRPGATARWNGAARNANVTGSTMTVSLTADDVAAPAVGRLTVTNPDASRTSNEMGIVVVASSPTLSIERTIEILHVDVAYDETRGVLYASVPSQARAHANEVVRIDPSTGAITGSVGIGGDSATLAITDDGQFLYAALRDVPRIVRIALASFTKDIEIVIPSTASADDIVPMLGAPRSIVVAHSAGTVVYDDDVARSTRAPESPFTSDRITRGPTATRIFGYNGESTEYGFRSLRIVNDGIHEETVTERIIEGFEVDIEYDGGYVYSSNGTVLDVMRMQKVGTIAASGIVRPDAANARVHFLNGTSINTFHYTALSSLGAFTHESLASHDKLIRRGADGLVVGGGSTIVLLRGSLVAD